MAVTGNIPRFIEKLRDITTKTPKHIAGWSKDGTVYEVRSELFETETLPTYFDAKQTMLSFSRQLNYYGIKKIDFYGMGRLGKHSVKKRAQGFVPWAIFHPCLRRDSPRLIFDIKRKTRKDKVAAPCAASKKGPVAAKSEIENVKKELKKLAGSMNHEMMEMKEQMARLERQFNNKRTRGESVMEYTDTEPCRPAKRSAIRSASLPELYETTFSTETKKYWSSG